MGGVCGGKRDGWGGGEVGGGGKRLVGRGSWGVGSECEGEEIGRGGAVKGRRVGGVGEGVKVCGRIGRADEGHG